MVEVLRDNVALSQGVPRGPPCRSADGLCHYLNP